MVRKNVRVEMTVEVTVDEAKFTDDFLREHAENFSPVETVDEHIEQLARYEAQGLLAEFTEGYGEIAKMGISARVLQVRAEIEAGR